MMIVKNSGEWNATYVSGESPLRKERKDKALSLVVATLFDFYSVSLFSFSSS